LCRYLNTVLTKKVSGSGRRLGGHEPSMGTIPDCVKK
jgi:hypothetical protein